ncbi:MAG: adenosine deaminase [Pseudomonadota bacterium]
MNAHELVRRLPKTELHLHIEGTLTPQRLFERAQKNNVTLQFDSAEALAAAYDFDSLQAFLDLYYLGMHTLLEEEDFYVLTRDYLEVCHQQNITYVEIGYDPQGHTERGIDFMVPWRGINQALDDAKKEWGIESGVILNLLRHLPEENALATLEAAEESGLELLAVGLDSSEQPFPPELFKRAFAKAQAVGWRTVAHAGEEGPADYIWSALKDLNIQRIDHGVRADEDEALMQYLVENQIPLTVCPLSNVRLAVYEHIGQHNILKMLEQGVLVTVNSDDPAYFGGYLNENFDALIDGLGAKEPQIVQLVRNGFEASFLSPHEKAKWQDRITQALG